MNVGRSYVLLLFAILILSCNRKKTLFSTVSPSESNIRFANNLEKRDHLNILYYLYYYNGGGVSIGDVNNDGLPDIYFTANHPGKNKLYLNKGNFKFEDVTGAAGVAGLSDWCSGSTMADVNGDGFLDIYVSTISNAHGLEGRNELYINNGNGTFTESAIKYGLNFAGFSSQAAFFDYDHDGDLDCYLLNQSQKPNQNIVDTGNRRKFDPVQGDRFYRNDGNSTFTDVSAEAGIYQSGLGYGLGIAVADFNNDGWEDIYIGNDFHENDYYYINNGNGSFTESGAKHFGHYSRFSMGNDAADFNNDGQIDIVTVDMLPPDEKVLKSYGSDENADIYKVKLEKNGFQFQYSKNCLQRNNGNGSSFSETGLISGIPATDWSWAPLLADFDNDGKKDLFVSSGIVKRPVDLDYIRFISDLYMKKNYAKTDKYDDQALEKMPDGKSRPFFFKGDGNLIFTEISHEWGTGNLEGYFTGAAYADLDNDGDLDIVINSLNSEALLLRNNSETRNNLSISFKGNNANKFGIGAKVYVMAASGMQYQQLMLTRGFQSSVEPRMHFGLPDSSVIDSVLVVWPDQQFQVIKNVPANKPLTVEQSDASGKFIYGSFFNSAPELITAATDVHLDWQHKENAFDDFNIQYLIPHAQSTRGPKFAVADINGDSLDDIYACGAKGQPGALFIQQLNGRFIRSDSALLNADAATEDVDAIFFDANNDGAKDLYVVSGGNEYVNKSPQLADRLYLNNGSGKFTKANAPELLFNKSCISYADIDNDGDNDVFIGVLADARAYGVPQTSYLLLNDGKGNFTVADKGIIDIEALGIVTSAVFADVNNDKAPDLIVVGEWMSVNVFINKNGKFERSQLPSSTGMWQTIFAGDINKDGNIDLLAGNWGLNNKFHSGKNGPVRLYVNDFDRNGQTDQLLSYTLNGEEFPFLAKDEVERPLPLLKKHYLRYSEYSGVPMKDVFYGWVDTIKPLMCEKLASAVFYGDGAGNFQMKELPAELQLAPVFSFQKTGNNTYLCGGNFFDVIPYEGRYDAQPLALFSVEKDSIQYIHQPQLSSVKKQVRDIKVIRSAGKKDIIAVAGNNSAPLFYEIKNKK